MVSRLATLSFIAFLLPALAAGQQQEQADSAAASRADSGLAAVDSAMVLDKSTAGESYLAGRERFSYPRTGRSDPFNLPLDRTGGKIMGPSLSDLLLTGVLYAPDGPRIAILGLATGESFLLHEGDKMGGAELVLIERKYVMFSISEFGRARDYVIELKSLAEGNDGKSPENAGNGGRQGESENQAENAEGEYPEDY